MKYGHDFITYLLLKRTFIYVSTFIHNDREEDAINRPVAECNAMD